MKARSTQCSKNVSSPAHLTTYQRRFSWFSILIPSSQQLDKWIKAKTKGWIKHEILVQFSIIYKLQIMHCKRSKHWTDFIQRHHFSTLYYKHHLWNNLIRNESNLSIIQSKISEASSNFSAWNQPSGYEIIRTVIVPRVRAWQNGTTSFDDLQHSMLRCDSNAEQTHPILQQWSFNYSRADCQFFRTQKSHNQTYCNYLQAAKLMFTTTSQITDAMCLVKINQSFVCAVAE